MSYVRECMKRLTEEEAQDLIQAAYEAEGWSVLNLHKEGRSQEKGVDLYCEKGKIKRLVAVKIRPDGGDIDQLLKLAKRSREGEIIYAHFADPTPQFNEKKDGLKEHVIFLDYSILHNLFLKNQVVEYLVHYFSVLPIAEELAYAVTDSWDCRHGIIPGGFEKESELVSIWKLKDAILKTRSAVGIVATRWEDNLMRRTEIEPGEFEAILDNITRDLDHVQRFTGKALAREFDRVKRETPHLLSLMWSDIRKRTNWIEFALWAEKKEKREDVELIARKFWAVPSSSSPLSLSKNNRASMMFFYSGLAGILRHLSQVTQELDYAIEWVWEDTVFKENKEK